MGPLIRWEPMSVRELGRLRREMNRLLEEFFGEEAMEIAPEERMRIPSVDVMDKDENIVVRAEMPGIDKDKIEVQAMPEALMIRAEMKKEAEEKKENYLRRETRMGTYQRIIPMPTEIKPGEVQANYQDGVLEITLPKSDEAKKRQPVKVDIK